MRVWGLGFLVSKEPVQAVAFKGLFEPIQAGYIYFAKLSPPKTLYKP